MRKTRKNVMKGKKGKKTRKSIYNLLNQNHNHNKINNNNNNNNSKKNKKSKKTRKTTTKFNIIMYSFYKEDDNTHTKEKDRCMCVDYDVKNNSFNMENNQDYRRCKHKAINGSNFCQKHQKCMNYLKLFTNNNEKSYDLDEEWKHPYIEGTHNCYSYFLDDKQKSLKEKCHKLCLKEGDNCPRKIKKCGNFKPQPGDYYLLMRDGHLKNKKRDYQCDKMEKKIFQDNPNLKKTSFFERCPQNYYKGAMVVDPNHTFHFYRQNKNGLWSHKPGTMRITDLDADNKQIPIPHFSNRDYSHKPNKINYTNFCGYYCIPGNNYLKTNSS